MFRSLSDLESREMFHQVRVNMSIVKITNGGVCAWKGGIYQGSLSNTKTHFSKGGFM